MLASTVEALKQGQQGEVASSVQVQETLRRMASVASDLEAKLSASSVAQEQLRVTAEASADIEREGHEGDTDAAIDAASRRAEGRSRKDWYSHPRAE